MSDTPTAAKSKKGIVLLTVFATLAAVFVFEKLLVMLPPTSDYRSRARRSEALLAAQEQRSKGYQEYFESVRANHERYEALLSREEEDAARSRKILDISEQQ